MGKNKPRDKCIRLAKIFIEIFGCSANLADS
ncbi:hypothetical protein KEJ21_05820, partial [Candidatus Bathyarchaeota archaeon]|nr:hypothetical protein [Candidatus Bathyarchaeota archaeon]